MEAERDKTLWKIAKKRVAFKRHASSYLVVNAFLWALWYFNSTYQSHYSGLPWPAWVTLGWGTALAFSYYDAYHAGHDAAAAREYEKLTRKKNS